MFNRKKFIIVSISNASYIINFKRSLILINISAINTIIYVPSVLYKIIKALIS